MNSSLAPKISVCIPVYNGSNYIAESIESVLAQTYKDFELIVVDNCSTDNTKEIVSNFHDPRLNYIRNKKNFGIVVNHNRCLELAKGEYVCIWHHDDVMLPDNLKFKVNLLDEQPEVGFVHSNLIIIDDKGEVVAPEIWYEGSRHDYIEDGLTAFKKYLSYLPYGASLFIGSVLARRSCYEKVGQFSVELPYCLDSEMWLRMMLFYKIACIGTPLVKYRVHQTTASSKKGNYAVVPYVKEHYLTAMMIFNKYNNLIPESHKLKGRVCLSFAERSIKLAKTAIINEDYSTAKSFVKEAIRMSPQILKNPYFWIVAGGISMGPNGFRFYKSIKKVLWNKNTQ
jgi:glycosyltransferase involved in cell wall biosynthesis